MTLKEKVEEVIEEIKPSLQAHGGDIELVDVSEDGVVKVKLRGACSGCPAATMTLQHGVQARLQERIPEVREVVGVEAGGTGSLQ